MAIIENTTEQAKAGANEGGYSGGYRQYHWESFLVLQLFT